MKRTEISKLIKKWYCNENLNTYTCLARGLNTNDNTLNLNKIGTQI